MVDGIDRKIVVMLQKNARITNADIARTVGIAPSAILERIRKLEERGVIQGYTAHVNRKAFDFRLTAFIMIRGPEGYYGSDFGKDLANFPEFVEVHSIAGEDCYIAKVVARDTEDLTHTMHKRFGELNMKVTTRTTIVLETIKEGGVLPIELERAEEN